MENNERPHARLIKIWAENKDAIVEMEGIFKDWSYINCPEWLSGCKYRLVIPKKTKRLRTLEELEEFNGKCIEDKIRKTFYRFDVSSLNNLIWFNLNIKRISIEELDCDYKFTDGSSFYIEEIEEEIIY